MRSKSVGLALSLAAIALLLSTGCGRDNPVSQKQEPVSLAKVIDRAPLTRDSVTTTDTPIMDSDSGEHPVLIRDLIGPAINPPGTIGVPSLITVRENRNVAVVTVTVTDNGSPVEGAEVGFSRSVSGKALDYRWTGTTDAFGQATVTITQDTWQFRRAGASGYYTARAIDGTTGTVIGRWGSLAISGGTDCGLSLPIGSRAYASRAARFAVGSTPIMRLGQEDEGRQVEVCVGRTVAIALPANPSTGYSWTVDAGDQGVITQATDAVFCQETELVGAPGYLTLQFYVAGEGQTTLELAYRRPLETDAVPLETYSVGVTGVDGGGPDISPPAPNVDWIDNTFPPVDSSDDVPTDRPMERADIRGRISTISAPTDGASAGRAGGSILVEGPAKTGGIDKAWTTITSETILVRMTESGYVKVSHSALIVGNEVMVQFEGPVMESYPVQATAGIIVIIG